MVTTEQVMQARADAGWVSPIAPLEPGELRCLFDQRGSWEWLVHPTDGEHYLEQGIVVNGERMTVRQVGDYPLLNAIQLTAKRSDAGLAFIPAGMEAAA